MNIDMLEELFSGRIDMSNKELIRQKDIVVTGYREELGIKSTELALNLLREEDTFIVYLDSFKDWDVDPYSLQFRNKSIPHKKAYGIYETFSTLESAESLYSEIASYIDQYCPPISRYGIGRSINKCALWINAEDCIVYDSIMFDNGDYRTKIYTSLKVNAHEKYVAINDRLGFWFNDLGDMQNFWQSLHNDMIIRNTGDAYYDRRLFSSTTQPQVHSLTQYKNTDSVMHTLNKILELPVKIFKDCQYELDSYGQPTSVSIKLRDGKELKWKQPNRQDYYWQVENQKNYEKWQQRFINSANTVFKDYFEKYLGGKENA